MEAQQNACGMSAPQRSCSETIVFTQFLRYIEYEIPTYRHTEVKWKLAFEAFPKTGISKTIRAIDEIKEIIKFFKNYIIQEF